MPHSRHGTDTRKPYTGSRRALVIAIDVGTTFSGVSYAILEPGAIPKILGLTRFPGQEHVAGNTKIPSVIYYDKDGKVMAAGAEADSTSTQAQAEDEGWIKAELFKLRLRPRTMHLNMNGMRLGPLPKRKTAIHVFGDFLAYLYRCTRSFICDTHAYGPHLWSQVEPDIQFVLAHPNGWEGAQQSKMRRAAIYGGLIPDTNEGKARIRFVTEGEASLHACVLNGLAKDVLSDPRHGFLIADAGGGTLDISAYAIRGTHPLVIEEIAPPDCIFAGSVFVSRRARVFLEEKLKSSRYGTPDALDHITRRFDETTKRLFRNKNDLQFIPFGSPLDKDSAVGIRGGQLKLTGEEVADLFEPSVDAAFRAIRAQLEASKGMIRSVFLVGGYAASPWLFQQLQERLAPFRVTVSRPDTQTSKAVADGAIGFYCDHHVSARMSRFMYGVEFLREMDPRDPDHVARREKLCELPSGPKLLPDAFDCILARGVTVKESTVFQRKYCTELTSLSMLSVFEVEIWCYRGGNTIPKWINRQADDFSTLCVVRADLSPLASSAEAKLGRSDKTYWTIVFSVEIQFGLTEFKARIKWVDNGMTKYGPASIIYNDRGHRADEDEPDVLPEDDLLSTGVSRSRSGAVTPRTPRSISDRMRSEPVSRARTPVASTAAGELYQPAMPPKSTTSSRRPSVSTINGHHNAGAGLGVPEVARVGRDERERYSTPTTPSSKHSSERYSSSSKGKERERDSIRDSIRSTPKSRLDETLTSVWGADQVQPSRSQSSAASSKRGSPTATEAAAAAQYQGLPGDRTSSAYASERSQTQTPATRKSQSPWVETISATIENPRTHSPWDTVPSASISVNASAVPRSIGLPEEGKSGGKKRISSLWDDAPRSAFGEPPKSPWVGSRASTAGAAGEDTTVLLATEGAYAGTPPIHSISRSVSIGNEGVPLDADDAPDLTKGWDASVGGIGNATPGRSRKNSIAATVVSAHVGTPLAGDALDFSNGDTTANDGWNWNNNDAQQGAEGGDAWGAPPVTTSGDNLDNQIATEAPKTPSAKTPKTPASILKTPKSSKIPKASKTPKTPVAENIISPPSVPAPAPVEQEPAPVTPVTPSEETSGAGGKKKKKKGGAAALAAAEEEEKRKREEDQKKRKEEERKQKEAEAREMERLRIAREEQERKEREEAERLAEEQERLAKEEQERLAKEEQERLAKEEEERLAKEEEERLAKEIADLEAKEKAEQEAREREEKERAAAAASTPASETAKGRKKKGKKGSPINIWNNAEDDEKERQAKEEEERLAKEKAEQEAREKAEQEAKEKEEQEKAAREAQEKEEQEAREKAEQEAKEKEEQDAKEKAEREAKEKEEAEKATASPVDDFAPAKGKKGKKKKGNAFTAWEDEEEKERERQAKEEEERLANEKAEQEAKEREEKERAEIEEKERAEREEKERTEREAKEKEEKERAAEEAKQQDGKDGNAETPSDSLFGLGSFGAPSWGSTLGKQAPSLGGWGLGTLGKTSSSNKASPEPSVFAGISGAFGLPNFGASSLFGANDFASKTDEIKLDDVTGVPANPAATMFDTPLDPSKSPRLHASSDLPATDDIELAKVSPSKAPSELNPALSAPPSKAPSARNSKAPSRAASRAPSPAPANAPDDTATAVDEAAPGDDAAAATTEATGAEPTTETADDWGYPVKSKKKKNKAAKGRK